MTTALKFHRTRWMDVGFTRPLNHIGSHQGDFIVRIIQGCRVEEHNREVLKEGRGGGEGHVQSIAFRHLPPTLRTSLSGTFLQHSEHRFLAPSSNTPGIAFRHLHPTLRASLSGTFLQTLPDLVTPLKGHSLSPSSCPPTRSAPSESFGY